MTWNLRSSLAFAVFLAGRLAAAEPALELSGVLTDGEKARFALTDKTTGQTTWVESGADHAGYTVDRYNPKDETVTLKKGLDEYTLRLVVAKSTDAANDTATTAATTPNAPANDPATLAIKNNLRQLAVAARQHQLNTGATSATVADLVGPDKYLKQLVPVDGENYAGLVFGSDASNLSVTTASGVTVAVDTAPTLGALASNATTTQTLSAPPPAAAPPPTPTGPINTSHVAREGDTLPKIAEAAGVPLEQLQLLNPDVNPGSLKVGQPIRIR